MDNFVRILLVEDEEAHSELVKRSLENKGKNIDLTVVGSIKDALSYINENPPNLLITDWLLPDGEGRELLNLNNDSIPFPAVVLTSHGSEEIAVEVLKAGALSYVVKTAESLANMSQTVDRTLREWKNIVERKRAEEQLAQYTVELENYAIYLKKKNQELKKAQEKLLLASNVFENTTEGIMVTDDQGNIQSVNPAFTTITGYDEEEIIGKNPRFLKSDRHTEEFYKEMWESIIKEGSWKGEIWNKRKNGDVYPEWKTINAIEDDNGEITHYVAVFSDITKVKLSEQRLNYMAYHDSLTGVANRLLFHDRLQQTIWQAERINAKLAVLFLDLDRFKIINDTLGHYIGDIVLRKVAEKLKKCVRESDTISRWGGDEFTIILPNIKKPQDAGLVADKIIEILSKGLIHEKHELYITASIGISIYPEDGRDLDTLLKNADNAMYQAKLQGKNNYQDEFLFIL